MQKKYRKIFCLGYGSHGTANLCEDRSTGIKFVMKIIPIHELSEEEKKSSMNEIQVLSKLNHPCIVKHIESFDEANFLYIIMEYCSGGDLANRIRRKENKNEYFSETQILQWTAQICSALEYIHANCILHRDIKTSNIYITDGDKVKVGDFGIAYQLREPFEMAKSVVGTPYSISPEVCQNIPYSFKSDIWALGCVLYELCMHKHAFESNNLLGLVWKIVKEPTPQLLNIYSSDLNRLFRNMLEKDPNNRPSASKMLQNKILRMHLHKVATRVTENIKTKLQKVSKSNKTVYELKSSIRKTVNEAKSEVSSDLKRISPNRNFTLNTESPGPGLQRISSNGYFTPSPNIIKSRRKSDIQSDLVERIKKSENQLCRKSIMKSDVLQKYNSHFFFNNSEILPDIRNIISKIDQKKNPDLPNPIKRSISDSYELQEYSNFQKNFEDNFNLEETSYSFSEPPSRMSSPTIFNNENQIADESEDYLSPEEKEKLDITVPPEKEIVSNSKLVFPMLNKSYQNFNINRSGF